MTPKKLEENKDENNLIKLAVMDEKLNNIQNDLKDLKDKMEGEFVHRMEFDPIKKLVYGLVGLILTIVITALVYVVIVK